MLLHLLNEEGELSGYEINKLVEARGFRVWADVGVTSIYVSLRKLEKKGLVESSFDTKKKGRGPVPKKIKLLSGGEKCLKDEVVGAISSAMSRGARFSLGIASISILTKDEIVFTMQARNNALIQVLDVLRQDKYEAQGGDKLPQHVKWLFHYSFRKLETEIEFSTSVLNDLK